MNHKRWEHFPHEADMGVRGIGRTRDEAFEQAALQPYVDNSISKTINVPRDFGFDDFKQIYERAYDMGPKGCTTFRPNPVTGEVLRGAIDSETGPHCCTVEREAD